MNASHGYCTMRFFLWYTVHTLQLFRNPVEKPFLMTKIYVHWIRIHFAIAFLVKTFIFIFVVNWISCFSQLECHMHSFMRVWFDRRYTYCVMFLFRVGCSDLSVCFRWKFSVLPSILNNNKINNSIFFHPIRFIAFMSLFCLFRRFRCGVPSSIASNLFCVGKYISEWYQNRFTCGAVFYFVDLFHFAM